MGVPKKPEYYDWAIIWNVDDDEEKTYNPRDEKRYS